MSEIAQAESQYKSEQSKPSLKVAAINLHEWSCFFKKLYLTSHVQYLKI